MHYGENKSILSAKNGMIMYTRKCLQLIDKYRFGLSILTKSNKILRDLDILKSINIKTKCVVQMTLKLLTLL